MSSVVQARALLPETRVYYRRSVLGSWPTWRPFHLMGNSFSVWGLRLAKPLGHCHSGECVDRCTLQRARESFFLLEEPIGD